jgi:hypothetical protein
MAPATSAAYWVQTDLLGERKVIMRDLYFIGPPVFYPNFNVGIVQEANFGAFPLIDSDAPLAYSPYAAIPYQAAGSNIITFQPFSVEKDKLDYKTGFEASSITLTMRPRDPNPATTTVGNVNPYTTRGNGNSYSEGLQVKAPYSDLYANYTVSGGATILYQTMRQSFAQNQDWYLAPVTMFRTFIPADNPTDLTSYGCAVMFRGRINSMTVDKEDVKITAASLMEIFKQKVPTQTIQPGNRWAPFAPLPYEPFFCTSATPPVNSNRNIARSKARIQEIRAEGRTAEDRLRWRQTGGV